MEGAAVGSAVRMGTHQPITGDTLAVDAGMGLLGAPTSAAGRLTGTRFGNELWRLNGHAATIPMNLPAY